MAKRTGPHMGVHKSQLLAWLRDEANDPKFLLAGFEGTREEAIAAVEADEREVFCSCDCKKAPNGTCTGLPS